MASTASRTSTTTATSRALLPAVLLLLLLLALTSANMRMPRNSKLPVESWLKTPQLIEHWGYPAETHTVKTDDGFLIDVHRIAGPKRSAGAGGGNATRSRRTPVLVAHGYAASSECLVLRPHDNLPFMMADAGFDVWLGNTRGNFYGKRHVALSPRDRKYWDFSWHENGVYDLRSTIDLVLRETGESSLCFVCHSMGCTSLFALLADRPDYNAKVRVGFLLAPAVYFYSPRGAFLQLKIRAPWTHRTLQQLTSEFPITANPHPTWCMAPEGMVVDPNCMKIFAEAQGQYYNMVNNTYMPTLLRHWPAGSSVGQTAHFAQLIVRGDGFRKYDYGPKRNRLEYGSARPPEYNVTNVRSPMFFYHSDTDFQANPKDVKRLASDVPGTAGLIRTPSKVFNHLDIMYDEAAGRLVYKRLIEQMKKYRST